MNKLFDIIGATVLCGILIKLSYVFFFLFDELDDGSVVGKITGITFAFASVWFIVKIPNKFLKIAMIMLDVCTIMYYYLHPLWSIPIQYIAIVIASYSGLIVFYIGRIVNEKLNAAAESETIRLQDELNRLRYESELRRIESEIKMCRRRISESKTDSTREMHEKRLRELENEYNELNNNCNNASND